MACTLPYRSSRDGAVRYRDRAKEVVYQRRRAPSPDLTISIIRDSNVTTASLTGPPSRITAGSTTHGPEGINRNARTAATTLRTSKCLILARSKLPRTASSRSSPLSLHFDPLSVVINDRRRALFRFFSRRPKRCGCDRQRGVLAAGRGVAKQATMALNFWFCGTIASESETRRDAR